ncbi:MAG: glutamate racemase [Saprospiraceae bacterium]|nr:MAG: glutamate racemase [Saprospiraceae bacterium]
MSGSNTKKAIGVFDSGIGGLSVANVVLAQLPKENIVYFGDNGRAPYGPKSPETITQYSLEIVRFLLEQDCKAIVVACNTASAAALNTLRETWPELPIIGMEPALKPAAAQTQTGKIGILATLGTFQSSRYASLAERFANGVEVLEDPCLGLVQLIESGKTDHPETEQLLHQIIGPMRAEGVDTLVLGCTHYPLIRPLIEKVTNHQVNIIDPAPAIARHLEHILEEKQLLNTTGPAWHKFYTSGNPAVMQRILRDWLKLEEKVQVHYWA